jgi:hypothetical protein
MNDRLDGLEVEALFQGHGNCGLFLRINWIKQWSVTLLADKSAGKLLKVLTGFRAASLPLIGIIAADWRVVCIQLKAQVGNHGSL